jgi:DNA polymerase (family 10)
MKNNEVADIFDMVADFLELKDENPFRIRAYRRAAQNIRTLARAVEEVAQEDGLEEIAGIGKDLAGKIKEIVLSGKLKDLEKLKGEMPEGLVTLMNVPGVGPKTTKVLYESLRIKDIDGLEQAARQGKLIGLPGIKEKTQENILKGIELVKKGRERMHLGKALSLANEIIDYVRSRVRVDRINACGSLRRMKETVRDIDILVTSKYPKEVMDMFVNVPHVAEVLAHGETKSSILTKDGVQVDLRVVEPGSYGAALVYFTGSKEHNVRIRELASKMGLKISEYGVFNEKTGKKVAGREEEDVYRTIGLSYTPPEMREDRGEVEQAAKSLPNLVELRDIKGDLHVHSKWTDGAHSIEEVAVACQKIGYDYVAMCDHTKSLPVAGGLTEQEVLRKNEEIRHLNSKMKNFRILTGVEVDIRTDGMLDYSNKVLSQLDIVVAAIHSGFKQSKDMLTNRIIGAMRNRYVHIIAHPTGRLMGTRDAYDIDMEEILKVAHETNTALEINAFPERLDVNDVTCRRAKELGVMLAIGTDTHFIDQLNFMHIGVSVARRGWLERNDLLNTLTCDELLKRIKK